LIWTKLKLFELAETLAAGVTIAGDETTGSAGDVAGPETRSEVPTMIGVGVVTGLMRGRIAGIEFVTTTFSGVGVGSTDD
jgi:hypothetical protein